MLNRIKCFDEVEFKEYNLPFGSLTLENIFKCPWQAVLDRSTFNKTLLIAMDDLRLNFCNRFANGLVMTLRQQLRSVMGLKSFIVARERTLGMRVIYESIIDAFEV